ncbi:phosphoprotein associated with glycosphingolipid-enriched microdomains 1 [Spea bombifrons]|uniref:phosphoprotein associated with glycosphingolipid-enriched microdomains 1 n=1 Tax=Spea bombifrons TaxID=233779 RepID=UPI00234AB948|nr:phosphoprotein associated with glycosphingolipid-enriched microdomains 1 [Spea bombifrons]XP_053323957.1 phosphoprotein associated with glycosphingolipid-enriched microdomains 1 [Spea bombifrons]
MAPALRDIVESSTGGLSNEQALYLAWGGLAAVSVILLVTIFLLCSSCDREENKKQHSGDHENLMNVPSDKETYSHSITSLGTDPPASYRNGAVSNGDVSEDSTAACIQPYEDVQSSLPDLCDLQDYSARSSRCHQSRELPRIPPNSNIETPLSPRDIEGDFPPGNEGPYEVLKDSSSHENIIEDSLYETVKEIKEVNALTGVEEGNRALDEQDGSQPVKVLRMEAAAEYASVDHNRKSRHSINTQSAASTPTSQEEDVPPPLPKKLLDENENVQSKEEDDQSEEKEDKLEGTSNEDKRQSSISYKSREEDPCLTDEEISAMYSSVSRPTPPRSLQEEFSHYSYIQDVGTDLSPTTCNGTYATVRDIDKNPGVISPSKDQINGGADPEYEAITTLTREEERTLPFSSTSQVVLPQGESDYESIGDLQHNSDYSRL